MLYSPIKNSLLKLEEKTKLMRFLSRGVAAFTLLHSEGSDDNHCHLCEKKDPPPP